LLIATLPLPLSTVDDAVSAFIGSAFTAGAAVAGPVMAGAVTDGAVRAGAVVVGATDGVWAKAGMARAIAATAIRGRKKDIDISCLKDRADDPPVLLRRRWMPIMAEDGRFEGISVSLCVHFRAVLLSSR
jgi:hypothetical protein